MDRASNGGFYVAGYKALTITNTDLFVMKVAENGRVAKPGMSMTVPGPLSIMENIFRSP